MILQILDIDAAATNIDSTAGVTITAATASSFKTNAGALTLNGAAGVDIKEHAAEKDISTDGKILDINWCNHIDIKQI